MSGDARVDAVVAHLNVRAGKNYRARHPDGTLTAAGDYVAKRLRQGYTVEQLLALVNVKADEWAHLPRTRRLLRPSTLFQWNKNFNEYMAQAEEHDGAAI